jgi:hypothetical protein
LFYLVLFIGVQLWEIQILRKSAKAEIDFHSQTHPAPVVWVVIRSKAAAGRAVIESTGKSFSSIITLGQQDGAGSLALSP